jgi:glycosyltransferase involved in cell wall biosynthesis
VRVQGQLLFVGRLVPKKGLETLLAAATQLKSSAPLTITVVGDGPLRVSLEAQAHDLGLTVRFLGALPHAEVLDLVACAWALCLPSKVAPDGDAEALGLVLLEAQARHTPVIASDSGGIGEIVEDGVTGLLFPEGDATHLALAIHRLATDPTLHTSLSLAGRARAEANFNIRTQGAILADLYQEVWEARRYRQIKQGR